VQLHVHLQLVLERLPDQAQHLPGFGRVGRGVPCHQGALKLESAPARQCFQVFRQFNHSFSHIRPCYCIIHIGPEFEVPGGDRHVSPISLRGLPQGRYCNASGRAIPEIHRRGDVYPHLLGAVAIPPHDSP
ncbi:MAG: hypothetical protein ACK56I_32925, partial [bacterium]